MKSYVIFGCGRFGAAVAKTLADLGSEVLVIDKNQDVINSISESVTTAVQCDIMDGKTVSELGLNNFDTAIIAIGDSLEASIMATMVSNEANISYILCKASNEMQGKILNKLGANKIIYPERDMGYRVGKMLSTKNLLDVVNLSSDYILTEARVEKKWVNKTIQELDIRNKYDITIIAIKRNNKLNISPASNEALKEDDILLILGEEEAIRKIYGKNE